MNRKIKLYNGKVEIYFDDERHIFTDKDGKYIFGTTSITGLLDKSIPIKFWAIGLMRDFLIEKIEQGFIIAQETIIEASKQHTIFKEKAADIGSLIHEFAEKWITLKKKPEIPEDEKVRNGAIAFLKWVKDTGVEFDNSEIVVYSKKYGYAGIMDADGHIGGKKCIIDFKSSSGIYNEMRYQLAAYWSAREEETEKEYELGYIVQFGKETGEFKVLEISKKEYEKDRKAFLGLLEVKQREQELKNGK